MPADTRSRALTTSETLSSSVPACGARLRNRGRLSARAASRAELAPLGRCQVGGLGVAARGT
eukprot:182363-Prymnesium_polylepis.1